MFNSEEFRNYKLVIKHYLEIGNSELEIRD